MACALVERGDRWLWARRSAAGLLGGLWELPGAEVTPGEGAARALRRALRERHGIEATVGARLAAVERALTHRRLRLEAYACEVRGDVPTGEALRWAPRGEAGMGLSTAALRLVEAVAASASRGRPPGP
jgi:ADP-ribose pyrophosphatase YjhB (NUDIX family)